MEEHVTGKMPRWFRMSCWSLPLFMVASASFATFRVLSGNGSVPPDEAGILALPWAMTVAGSIVFLRLTNSVSVGPDGITVKRIAWPKRFLPAHEIKELKPHHDEGRRFLRVLPSRGRRITLPEVLSNFDAIVDRLVEVTGKPVEGDAEPLLAADVASRTIYLYQSNQFAWDHLYAVVVRWPGLNFLKVGKQLLGSDPVPNVGDPTTFVDLKMLEKYGGVSLSSDAALAVHKENFRMTASEISRANVRARCSWRTGKAPNSGLVTIHPRHGRPKKYVLIGNQDPGFAVRLLQEAGIRVQRT